MKQRETWVDAVKVIACVLVVLGHFFQSMTKADIMQPGDLYIWFNKTIYYFHVPLFFICSGYLYQRYSKIGSIRAWADNVLKKLLTLGVPYFSFSIITWLLKTVFAGSVNSEIGGLFETLFLKPVSPYWYLYCLFFLFLTTPTFHSDRMAMIGIAVALGMKVLALSGGAFLYVLSVVLTNEIWFVAGMCLARGIDSYGVKPMKAWMSISLGILFVILSIILSGSDSGWISFSLGILACVAVVELVRGICINDKKGRHSTVFIFLSKYTMPIFVMHTLFAAPLRVVLLKVGIRTCVIHVILGIAISFIGPVAAAEIMRKTKVLEFLLYPGKYIHPGKRRVSK